MSPPEPLSAVLVRFGPGLSLGLAAGIVAFRLAVFDPTTLAFHCLTIGALVAGNLALMRSNRLSQAATVTIGFALLRLGFAKSQGWTAVISGTLLIAGVFLVCLIFDLLARQGIRFGKFLVLGPLLGGIYLAITPLAEYRRLVGEDFLGTVMRYVFLGVLIGDAVGLGVEFADFVLRRLREIAGVHDGPG